MPELAGDESPFGVDCVGDELPRFNMFLGIYPRNIQEISCLFQMVSEANIGERDGNRTINEGMTPSEIKSPPEVARWE